MMRISIDQHPFDVVEVDDTPIYGPEGIHEVQVSAGQRTSIIINTDQGKAGDAFFLRSNVVTGELRCTRRTEEPIAYTTVEQRVSDEEV
jgi:hypothetical protein